LKALKEYVSLGHSLTTIYLCQEPLLEITLKNYRCFPDSRPATFDISPGLTALVGVNNAGKSALLKCFLEFRSLFDQLCGTTNFIAALQQGNPPQAFGLASVLDLSEICSNANERNVELIFNFEGVSPTSTLRPTRLAIRIPRATNTYRAELDLGDGFKPLSLHGLSGSQILRMGAQPIDGSVLFECFQTIRDTLYIGPFRNAINIGTKTDYFDIKIGQSFIDQWRSFKTGPIKRDNELILKVTEDIRRIFGFTNLQIDASAEAQTLQVFVDGKSYKLPELGSGLAQFAIVLGNAAIRNPNYILIDEPELNLHPSLMLDFLTSLASYAKLGVIFGTHNLGLARAAADRIFSLRRISQGESEISAYESTPRLAEFLGELSFAGYQELGVDKILLVEGATDVKVMQQFLRMYDMDHKIVLLQLGGSSMINAGSASQLLEIKRISSKIWALIDSERHAAGEALPRDREGFAAVCGGADIPCHVLRRRAIDNYLSDAAVKQVKGTQFRALSEYEKLNDVSPAWAKSEGWRIASKMSKSEIEHTDLGQFLETLSLGNLSLFSARKRSFP
jgi:ABC-type Mn2+/Zn2+ transport system ATPase subunit